MPRTQPRIAHHPNLIRQAIGPWRRALPKFAEGGEQLGLCERRIERAGLVSRFTAQARHTTANTLVVPPIVVRKVVLGNAGEVVTPGGQRGARGRIGVVSREVGRR